MSYKELQVILARVGSRSTTALVDSGSNCSVITLGLVKAIKKELQIKYAEIRARTWNSRDATFLGRIRLNFHIGNIKFNTEFLVASKLECQTGLLLGNDFLRDAGCTINFTPEKVTMFVNQGQVEIPLLYGRTKQTKSNVLHIYNTVAEKKN